MYEAYWHLDSKPFENTPDPRFLYYSPSHEEALMRLLYVARENKQGAILTGEYGSGKTVLSRVLLQDLNGDDRFQTILVVNPRIPRKEFLREILFQMGARETSNNQGEVELLRLLEGKLQQNFEKKKRTILIVDEAQTLDERELEDIRLLLNFQNRDAFLITLILIGQVGLKRKIQSNEPLKQRLALRYHLEPLTLSEVEVYITHRLGVAGRRDPPLFSLGGIGLIYEGSRGIPRQINNICDHALLVGLSRRVAQIGSEVIEDCLKDLDLLKGRPVDLVAREPATQDWTHGTTSRHTEEDKAPAGGEDRRGTTGVQRFEIS